MKKQQHFSIERYENALCWFPTNKPVSSPPTEKNRLVPCEQIVSTCIRCVIELSAFCVSSALAPILCVIQKCGKGNTIYTTQNTEFSIRTYKYRYWRLFNSSWWWWRQCHRIFPQNDASSSFLYSMSHKISLSLSLYISFLRFEFRILSSSHNDILHAKCSAFFSMSFIWWNLSEIELYENFPTICSLFRGHLQIWCLVQFYVWEREFVWSSLSLSVFTVHKPSWYMVHTIQTLNFRWPLNLSKTTNS